MALTPAEVILAGQLLTSGLDFWATFSKKVSDGTAVTADLEAAGKQLDVDIADFERNVNGGKQNPSA